MDSSITGSLILYCSLDQFPKSIKRQRSLQKGNSGSVSESTGFRQIGHRRVIRPSIPQSEAELCSPELYCATTRRIDQRDRIGNKFFEAGRMVPGMT